MLAWLKCKTLDAVENQLIRYLHAAALQGLAQFGSAREYICMNHFPSVLSAISKARAEGILQSWPTEAPSA